MKLVLDLAKASTLDTTRLIQKPVLVRGSDGRVFTRKQWVKPGEAPTTERHKKPEKVAEKKNPKFNPLQPPKLSREEINSAREKATKFYEDVNNLKKEKEQTSQDISKGNDPISKDSPFTTKEFITNYSKDPMVDYIIKNSIIPHKTDSDNPKEILSSLRDAVSFRDVKALVSDKINKSTHDILVRGMQRQALEIGNVNHSLSIAAHPDLAREAVNKVLGKETADLFRNDMKDANLSINFHTENKESIEDEGYIASTPEKYIESSSDIANDFIHILKGIKNKEFDSEQERIDYLLEAASPRHDTEELYLRADAEYKSIGLHLDDDKPTYIAFNPINNPTGGCMGYGAEWLKVDESVLRNSTVTLDDSFNEERSFAKVWDMEHLKDIFILKSVEMHRGLDIKDPEGVPWYSRSTLDIPLEIQYHKPSLPTKKFEIQPDPTDLGHDYDHTQDLDYDGDIDDLYELDIDQPENDDTELDFDDDDDEEDTTPVKKDDHPYGGDKYDPFYS